MRFFGRKSLEERIAIASKAAADAAVTEYKKSQQADPVVKHALDEAEKFKANELRYKELFGHDLQIGTIRELMQELPHRVVIEWTTPDNHRFVIRTEKTYDEVDLIKQKLEKQRDERQLY